MKAVIRDSGSVIRKSRVACLPERGIHSHCSPITNPQSPITRAGGAP